MRGSPEWGHSVLASDWWRRWADFESCSRIGACACRCCGAKVAFGLRKTLLFEEKWGCGRWGCGMWRVGMRARHNHILLLCKHPTSIQAPYYYYYDTGILHKHPDTIHASYYYTSTLLLYKHPTTMQASCYYTSILLLCKHIQSLMHFQDMHAEYECAQYI